MYLISKKRPGSAYWDAKQFNLVANCFVLLVNRHKTATAARLCDGKDDDGQMAETVVVVVVAFANGPRLATTRNLIWMTFALIFKFRLNCWSGNEAVVGPTHCSSRRSFTLRMGIAISWLIQRERKISQPNKKGRKVIYGWWSQWLDEGSIF